MKNIFSKLVFCLLLSFAFIGNVWAANYTISLSNSNVGANKSVNLYIKGNDVIGSFSVSSSDTTICSVSESRIWIENNSYTVKVNTQKLGSCTIKVSPVSLSDGNGNDINLPTKTLTLNVTSGGSVDNTNRSNDATLKSLNIEGISLNPEFKSDVYEYNAEVEAGTEKIKINASTNDSKASVSGTGEVNVSNGMNKIEVVVTAEDKSTKTYIINVNVKEFKPINVKIGKDNYTVVRNEKDLPEVDLFIKSKVKIGEEEVVGYYNEKLNIYLIALKDKTGKIGLYVYDTKKEKYTEYKWITIGGVTLYLKDNSKIPPNYNKYKLTVKDTETYIYKINSNDKVGLLYGINVMTGNMCYYVYDIEEETLARYYDKEVTIYKDMVKKYKNYMMIGIGIVSGVIILFIIISLIKGKKKHRKIKK